MQIFRYMVCIWESYEKEMEKLHAGISKQDLQEFQKLPTEKLDAMLTDTPKYLREIIANVFLAFMLKARVPIDEATSLADKVKEKQMGQLFEHMDDINLNADLIKIETEENGIKALVLCCHEFHAPIESIISKLMEHFSLSYETAKEKTEFYLNQ